MRTLQKRAAFLANELQTWGLTPTSSCIGAGALSTSGVGPPRNHWFPGAERRRTAGHPAEPIATEDCSWYQYVKIAVSHVAEHRTAGHSA
jgi:hypothetical protein